MSVESTSPTRAHLRCLEWLNSRLEKAGLDDVIESVRVETEPLPPEWLKGGGE